MLITLQKLVHEKKEIIAIEKIGQKREISLVLWVRREKKCLYFLHYCEKVFVKSHLKQILQSFRASCLDAKPTIYRFCRRSGDKIDALKHGTWKLISTLRTEYLSTSDSRWKKGYTRRDVSFSPHERLKTVLYHPECNHLFNGGLEK